MGDRANAVVLDSFKEPEAVFLYSHWAGTELPDTVRTALAKEWRWDDSAYLARIVFDQMIGDAQGEETSYGIATRPPDNEYDFIVLRPSTSRLYRVPEEHWKAHGFTELDGLPSISFEDFVSETERTWENLTT